MFLGRYLVNELSENLTILFTSYTFDVESGNLPIVDPISELGGITVLAPGLSGAKSI